VYNYAISSYTPTLSALLSSSQSADDFQGVLAVGQTDTPGFQPLPGTTQELNCIRQQAQGVPYTQLDGEKATATAVLKALESHSWVHLACHASQNPSDPTASAFHLHDGALRLATIMQKSFKNKGLAFLSACQTATGDADLPDEAVHLAAGMLMAGFPAVIATMWSIQDKDAPLIAEEVYNMLLKEGKPNSGRAATALHVAVGRLREQVGDKAFTSWVPYIHLGI
jgi:CHAT domain-containing protein